MQVSRRQVFGRLIATPVIVVGGFSAVASSGQLMAAAAVSRPSRSTRWSRFETLCESLDRRVEDETCDRFLRALEFEGYDGKVLTLSVAEGFSDPWIIEVLEDELLSAARSGGYRHVARVDVTRRPLGWKSPDDPVSAVSGWGYRE